MGNEASPYRQLGLSNIEATQAERRSPGDRVAAALVQDFLDSPKGRDAFQNVGTSPEITALYGKKPYPGLQWDMLRAAVLAEPEGVYEARYRALPRDEKRAELLGQIEGSAEMTVRLERYVVRLGAMLSAVPDHELYTKLLTVAFGTTDLDTLRREYALSQRRGFRLAIVNFLETRHLLEPYREEARVDPKVFVERHLGRQFAGPVRIEELPVGFAVYLGEEDYARVETDDHSPASITTKGVVLTDPPLPEVLRSRVAVINTGGEVTGHYSPDDLAVTLGHETRHILFGEFHEQHLYPPQRISRSAESDEAKGFFTYSRSVREWYTERAKDEITAYFSTACSEGVGYRSLGFTGYQKRSADLDRALARADDLSTAQKQRIRDRFLHDRRGCVEDIARLRIVAERLFQHSPKRTRYERLLKRVGLTDTVDHQNALAEALLRNTPGTKAHRLARYAGLHPEDVRNGNVVREQERFLAAQLRTLQSVPDDPDSVWWKGTQHVLDEVLRRMTPALLPALLETALCVPYRQNTPTLVEWVLTIVRQYVDLFGATEADRQAIERAMCRVIARCPEGDSAAGYTEVKGLALSIFAGFCSPA